MRDRDFTTAGDAMTPHPFTARPDERLIDAGHRMHDHGIRHLPVVDELDHVVGMLSERDVRALAAFGAHARLDGPLPALQVRDAMARAQITVTADRALEDVARIFDDEHLDAIAVVGHDRRLIGIVSYVDLLGELSRRARVQRAS